METLLEILKKIDDEIDWEKEKKLVDDRILDSITVITLLGELEESFGIMVDAEEIVPKNFNSTEAIYAMICRLQQD